VVCKIHHELLQPGKWGFQGWEHTPLHSKCFASEISIFKGILKFKTQAISKTKKHKINSVEVKFKKKKKYYSHDSLQVKIYNRFKKL
jgi:hypothetical protein